MQSLSAVKDFVEFAGGDGHSIYSPQIFLDIGFDAAFVKQFTSEHDSDDTYKGSIFKDGKRVASLEGVYALDFAYGVAEDIGADQLAALHMRGRGFQAQALAVAINTKMKELNA